MNYNKLSSKLRIENLLTSVTLNSVRNDLASNIDAIWTRFTSNITENGISVPCSEGCGFRHYPGTSILRSDEPILLTCDRDSKESTSLAVGLEHRDSNGAFKVYAMLDSMWGLSQHLAPANTGCAGSYGWKHVFERFRVDGYTQYVSNLDFKLAYMIWYQQYFDFSVKPFVMGIPNPIRYRMPAAAEVFYEVHRGGEY